MEDTTAFDPAAVPFADQERSEGVVKRFFASGARDWGFSEAKVKTIFALPFVIMLIGVIAALLGKEVYKTFTGEDRVSEYLQVVGWVVAFGLACSILKKAKLIDDRFIITLYAILAVGIIFLIGEEVSWGQRWFGWETPETYREINKQSETNIHNLHGVERTLKFVHTTIGACGTFLPLVMLRIRKSSPNYQRWTMLVPHYTLIPFFLTTFLWRLYRNVSVPPRRYYFVVAEYAEVMELILALAFVFFLLYQKRRLDRLHS